MKAIKESEQAGKKDLKYLTITEVPEEAVTQEGSLSDKTSLLSKCDAIVMLFESNDREQTDFLKEALAKLQTHTELQFVPVIFIQTKMDLQASGESRSVAGQTLAKEHGVKVYKEISSK